VIVADTNTIAYLLIAGERSLQARKVLRRDPEWAAPLLWRSEFRSVIALYLRRKLMSLAQALQVTEEAENLMRGSEYEVTSSRVLSLASESQCSAYDCEFVALAQELGVPLVTSDGRILSEFPTTAVSPEDFAP
jgi:predicted nucleic acid-binding protein